MLLGYFYAVLIATSYAVVRVSAFAAVLFIRFVVRFSLTERKTNNRLKEKYLAAAGKLLIKRRLRKSCYHVIVSDALYLMVNHSLRICKSLNSQLYPQNLHYCFKVLGYPLQAVILLQI